MTHVREAVRRAARRLWLLDALRVLALVLTAGVGALIVTRLVEMVFGLSHVFAPLWTWIAIGMAGAVVVTTIVWTHIARKRALAVATELDERAGLKEALSTALCVAKSDDPWSRAMLETAEEKARRVDVRAAIPFALPRLWPMPIATLIGMLVIWIAVPRMDVMGLFAQKEEQETKKREIVQVKQEREADQKKLEELLKRANVDLKDEANKEGKEGEQSKELDPEAIRRAAVRDLTNLADQLADQKTESEKAAQLEAMKEALQQLKAPGQGPLDDFSKNLAKGDFNKAQEALQQLQQQLADSSMTPEQKDQLKKQMENLAEQLKKASDQQEQVAKKLQEQGLDKKSAEELAKKASDPAALKEAMEQMKNLSPEQMQQLMKMAQAASEACKNAGQMSESMSKAAEGMTQEGMQQEGMEGMESMQAQLSEMEMMASDMENLDAALSECKSQLAKLGNCLGGQCQGDGENSGEGMGEWAEGSSNKQGNGSGGPGQGNSPFGPDEAPADYTQVKQKAPTQDRGGATIGTRLVQGEQVKGESKAEFAEVVTAATAAAAESIETGQVPREHHNAIKHYFGTLKNKGGAAPAKPAAPAAPVENATDAAPKK